METPYYATDLLPTETVCKAWTIHGAFSHKSDAWRKIVEAGEEVYAQALACVLFRSNDPCPLVDDGVRSHPYGQAAVMLYRKDDPVPFEDVARYLWYEERRIFGLE